MQIVKSETIRFSDNELRAIEMTTMLIENVVRSATDPNLIEVASALDKNLCDFWDYVEDVIV